MNEKKETRGACDEQRREFLKTSMYAAYATPVIMSMLVEKASAAVSQTPACDNVPPCSNPNCPPPPGGCP